MEYKLAQSKTLLAQIVLNLCIKGEYTSEYLKHAGFVKGAGSGK